jgi:hypothetical protein
MDKTVSVRLQETVADIEEEAHQLIDEGLAAAFERRLAQPFAEIPAAEDLHDDVPMSLGRDPRVGHTDDVAMPKPHGGLRLAEEALPRHLVVGSGPRQDLYRLLLPEGQVHRLEDRR